jgi:hypothetical protein
MLGPALTLLAVLVSVAPSGPPANGAATTRQDSVTATVHRRANQGGALVYAGVAHSRVFGRGAVIEHARVHGLDSTGTFTIAYRGGKVRGHSLSRGKPHTNLTVTFTGTYRITSGTGAYRHVRGHGTFSGSGPLDLSRATFRQRGSITY